MMGNIVGQHTLILWVNGVFGYANLIDFGWGENPGAHGKARALFQWSLWFTVKLMEKSLGKS
jgi:hypothetical protein